MSTSQTVVASSLQEKYSEAPLSKEVINMVLGEAEKESFYTLGYVLYQQGKYTDAMAFFQLLSLHNPNDVRYYVALAACQKMTKEYEKAISNYALALLLQPDQVEHRLHIAECQIAAQYTQGAIDTLTQLLNLERPKSSQADSMRNKATSLLSLLEATD